MIKPALTLARIGWPVFPCDPEKKTPLVAGADLDDAGKRIPQTGGLYRATTNEAQLVQWFTRWPSAMLGVPTGVRSGFWVTDFDVVNKATDQRVEPVIARLEEELGQALPPTKASRTGSGGRHLLWRWPSDGVTINNRGGLNLSKLDPPGELLRKIDIRGQGGYIIVPPSVRSDGTFYEWINDLEPIDAPPALVDLILLRGKWQRVETVRSAGAGATVHELRPDENTARREAIERWGFAAIQKSIRELLATPEGNRNTELNNAAMRIAGIAAAGGMEPRLARTLLEDAIAGAGWKDHHKSLGTIASGFNAGLKNPADTSHVGRRRSERPRMAAAAPPIDPPPGFYEPPQPRLRAVNGSGNGRLDPDRNLPRFGVPPGKWTGDELGLPREDPCPVIPLGYEAQTYYFLDAKGQFEAVEALTGFSHAGIQTLFAPYFNYPGWAWPRPGKPKMNGESGKLEPVLAASFKDDDVRDHLQRACALKGSMDAEEKVRGRGCWTNAEGGIIYHAGRELWTAAAGGHLVKHATGLMSDGLGERVYPAFPPMPAPAAKQFTIDKHPARQILADFKTWKWDRPDIDPVLLLGWIGVAYLGGALDWRTAIFLIGDKGTGKSELQKYLKSIFGDFLFASANTSAAGIYQKLGRDCRPVSVDELEASADNRRTQEVMSLARQASSGATGYRGGGSGTGTQFQIRSAFWFAAINPPPLEAADLSRIAPLHLRDLPPERSEPPALPDATVGPAILGQLLRNWYRWPAAYRAAREALEAGGHVNRGKDTYGALLAAADLICGPELSEELGLHLADDIGAWSTLLHVSRLPEIADALPNWRQCINHLLTAQVPAWQRGGGGRNSVGQLLADLRDPDYADSFGFAAARRQLAQAGLGIRRETGGRYILAIPHQSPLVEALFRGSKWAGIPGAGTWTEALRQAPATIVRRHASRSATVAVGGVPHICSLFVLDEFEKPTAGEIIDLDQGGEELRP